MIVGRELGSTFPPKASAVAKDVNFSVRSLSGAKFKDVSFDAAPGQIIGVAGVAGNGQSELMRALAGLQPSEGAISLGGRSLTSAATSCAKPPTCRRTGSPRDWPADLTVRENASMSALETFASLGIVSRRREVDQVTEAFRSLAVKAASIESPVTVALRRQSAEGRAGARAARRTQA